MTAVPEGDASAEKKDVDMVAAADVDAVVEEKEDPNREREQDAAPETRATLSANDVAVNGMDATLNVLPATCGRLVTTLTDGGMQYLLAGARATHGVKSGRYMFEVRVVEQLTPVDAQGGRGRSSKASSQVVRVGVSTAGSSLFLTEGAENVCFDSDGYFVHGETWKKNVVQRFGRAQTLSVVLNLDDKSPNANTISLFSDGARISQPQPLPESMRGKALFPTITFRSVTLQLNFGNKPKAALPFKCRMLGEAAQADVEPGPAGKPAGQKANVTFPIGLPEHGFFDYVDQFLAAHPGCAELSDRSLLAWASKSGFGKAEASSGTNDSPQMHSGVASLDDFSVRKVLDAVAPLLKRDIIVVELRKNLLAKERKQALLRFPSGDFKKTATVLLGEPAEDYRAHIQGLFLKAKQAKAAEEKEREAREAARKAKFDKPKEAEKKAEEPAEKKEGEETAEKKEGEEPKKAEEEAKMEVEEAAITLTEEEKAVKHRKLTLQDLSERVLSRTYAEFSLATAEEGFDEVTYAWQDAEASANFLKAWVLQKKLTERVDDLQPGDWFKDTWDNWQTSLQEWKRIHHDYKDPAKRPAKKPMAATDEGAEEAKAEGAEDVEAASVEPADVKDINDVGNGEPLYSNFVYEDWALLSIRFEFHLLLQAFKRDMADADRPSFSETHLAFYYQKYYHKQFSLSSYGVETFAEFLDFIKDTVTIDKEQHGFLKAGQAEDTPVDKFVRLAEEHRRERQQLVDAGDETAKLKFSRPAPNASGRGGGGSGDKGSGRGSYQQSSHRGGGGSSRSGGNYGSSGGGGYSGGQKRSYEQPRQGGSSYGGGASKQPRSGSGYGGSGSYSGGGGYSRR